jgi:hypothetical protein
VKCTDCINVYFVPECEITQPLIVRVGKVSNERNFSLYFSAETDDDSFDALLPIQE